LACVDATAVEYGVVEWRFAARSPSAYRTLVKEYGHRSIAPTTYSASMFLAHALGQLEREGLLEKGWTAGSGCWDYLTRVSAWATKGVPMTTVVSWEAWAKEQQLAPRPWAPPALAK
jgi:hypothetical protein